MSWVLNKIGKVSVPTHPAKKTVKKSLTLPTLYPFTWIKNRKPEFEAQDLDEKLHKAYFWITNFAIITPFYDIEYQTAIPGSGGRPEVAGHFSFGAGLFQLYSSSPVKPYCAETMLFIGGPRSEAASAMLMGLLAVFHERGEAGISTASLKWPFQTF